MTGKPSSRQAKARAIFPALLALSVLSACGNSKDAGAGGQGPPQGPPPVTAAQPLQQTIVDWDDYVGRFQATKSVEIRPRVSGYLQSIHFKDGQLVRRGDLLFVIDPRPYLATLAQSEAQLRRQRATLALNRAEFARSERLAASGAVSKEEVDQRRAAVGTAIADVAAAQADVRAATLNVEFTRIRSPINGRVSNRRVDIGNLVGGSGGSAGMTGGGSASASQGDMPTAAGGAGSGGTGSDGSLLTTVVALDPIYFTFDASEALYLKYARQNAAGTRISSRIRANPVEIRLQDEGDYRIHGQMDFVDNAIDVGAGTIRGRAVVANADGFLTAGMFGRMRLLGSGSYPALLIPDGAVQTDQTRHTVLVVGDKNVATTRVVELGPLINGLRVVRSGLKPSDRVIINGLQLAQAGKPVKPIAGKVTAPAPGTGAQEAAYSTPPASEATLAK